MVTFDGYDVELSRGDTLAIKIDLSGRDLPEGTDGVFTIKKRVKDDEVVLQKRFDASDETLTVVLDADETNIEPGTYYWDVRLQIPAEDGGYEVYTPMEYAAFVVLPVVGVDIGVDGSNMVNPDLPVLQVILSDSKRALAEMQDALGSIESLKTLVNDAENSVVAANAATERAEQAAQKWEDSTAANAEKLGGIPAENYLQKTETAADSSKLGGKAPEYYLSPRNLLDNSDFTNPVNQRGQTSYTASGYNIDRWRTYSAASVSLTTEGIVIDTTTVAGNLRQNIAELPNGIYTFAAKVNGAIKTRVVQNTDGTITTIDNSNAAFTGGYITLGKESSWYNAQIVNIVGYTNTIEWAALYEGEYTAETLPPYVPKGYAVELMECRRYFQAGIMCSGYGAGTNYVMTSKEFVPPFRVKPTITVLQITDGSADMDITNATTHSSNFTNAHIQFIKNEGKVVAQTTYSVMFDASADL